MSSNSSHLILIGEWELFQRQIFTYELTTYLFIQMK